ncbi:MAG: HD domain-containing phosphohydrolase [Sterolibacterium sp.]
MSCDQANVANNAPEQLTDALSLRCERFKNIFRLQGMIARERDNRKLSAIIMHEVTRLVDVDRGSLFLYDNITGELRAAYADGLEADSLIVPLRMGVIGAAILQRHCINIVNAYQNEFFCSTVDADSGYRTDSVLAMPIVTQQGNVIGGLQLINKLVGRFTLEDEDRLNAIAEYLAATSSEGWIDTELARQKIDVLREEVGCDRCAVFQLDEATGQLVSVYANGLDKQITLRVRVGIAGLVALNGKTLVVLDPAKDPRFNPSFDRLTGYQTRNILTVPLKASSNGTLGVIQLINRRCGDFSDDDIELLETIAGVVAVVVENGNLVSDIDRQFHSFLETMTASLDARDKLTASHSCRVAEIALKIALELGFDADDLDILKVAAMLHDYGKIGVNDAVLRKNGMLDEAEYRHMKTHAEMTHEILEKVYFTRKYRGVPLIAASHHEALDGSGYPRGLHGQNIPFMAKILTVADVFEALSSDRHYRKKMDKAAAMAILDAGIGTKFDAKVVAALKRSSANADSDGAKLL